MAVYEYKCDSCEHQWEIEQKMTDKNIEQCPSCEGNSIKKLISLGSFHLKGSGWYKSGGY